MNNVLRTKKFYALVFSTVILIVLTSIRLVDNTSKEVLACINNSLNSATLNNIDIKNVDQKEICKRIIFDKNTETTCLYNVRQMSPKGTYKIATFLVDYKSGVKAEGVSEKIEQHCNQAEFIDKKNPNN